MFNPANVPAHLIQKYSQRVPRYTSYPTAPHFTTEVNSQEIFDHWQTTNKENSALSVYMHIPFCAERCWFCGCNTVITKKNERADVYLDFLIKEMNHASKYLQQNRPIEQLAVGGGTPNFLTAQQIHLLFAEFKKVWQFSKQAEVSVELDPRTVSEEQLLAFLEQGFNRFSMGVQDFNPVVLQAIHRNQSLEHTIYLVEILKKHNISAFNFDLIYGLPAQTPQTMSETIETVLRYRPSRIALYSYAHVPWMKSHQKLLERHTLPSPSEKLAIFGTAYELLVNNGYVHIGMDHFSLPNDSMVTALKEKTLHRNFMGYTTKRGLDLLGLGTSSISSVGKTYSQNMRDEALYRKSVNETHYAIERGYILSHEDTMRRELIIDLFCNFYLNTKAFSKKWQIDFLEHFAPEMKELLVLQDDGLVELTSSTIEVTQMGRALIRNVCVVFDQYMEQDPSKRAYSQAV